MGGKLSGLLLLIGALFLFMHIELCISTSDLSQSSTRIIGNEQDLRVSTITQGGHNGIPYVILKGGGGGGGGKGGGSGGGSKRGGSGGGSKGGGGNGGKKRRGGSGTGDGSSGTGGRGGGSDSGGGGGGSRRSSGESSANIGIGSWRSAMGLVMLTTLYIIM